MPTRYISLWYGLRLWRIGQKQLLHGFTAHNIVQLPGWMRLWWGGVPLTATVQASVVYSMRQTQVTILPTEFRKAIKPPRPLRRICAHTLALQGRLYRQIT